jgi:hypothetical protein
MEDATTPAYHDDPTISDRDSSRTVDSLLRDSDMPSASPPLDTEAFAALRLEITSARDVGVMHLVLEEPAVVTSDDPVSLIDSTLTRLGFIALSTEWREVLPDQAARILTNVLHRDLAYTAEIMPVEVAEQIAARFRAIFPTTTRYFTNGTWRAGRSGEFEQPVSWSPLTEATCDAGIVADGEGFVALAWVEDED